MLPEALAARGVSLLRETAEDYGFLANLYISVRWEELTPTGWPDAIKIEFLNSQFALQVKHYTTYYHDAVLSLVMVGEQPVGRLYLYRGAQDLRIVDVSLVPQWRGRGLGTALLAAVQDEARPNGQSVSIHVEQDNPARSLYGRMGFHDVQLKGVYWLMEWRSDAPSPSTPISEAP